MIQGIDRTDQNNSLSLLIADGVANTEMVTREYQFTADNELDYSASIAAAATVTITELPSNTIAIYVSISLSRIAAEPPALVIKRQSTDVNFCLQLFIGDTTSNTKYTRLNQWIPTNGNQFYIFGFSGSCQEFQIMGYEVKE